MSKSDETAAEKGWLDVEAPDGVEISIKSGAFTEVARDFERVERELAQGIYTVRWETAGRASQKLVRLLPKQRISLSYDDAKDREEGDAIRSLISLQPIGKGDGRLIIVLRGTDGELTTSIARDFRVRKVDRSKPTDLSLTEHRDGWHGIVASLGHGTYVLYYKTADRIAVEQSIHIFPGRVTVVLMAVQRAALLERTKDETRFRSREGINTSATRIFSLSDQGGHDDIEALARLAGTLTERLAKNGHSLEQGLTKQIERHTDPYLLSYAAAVLLDPPGRGAITESSTSNRKPATDQAEAYLQQLPSAPASYPPDTECGHWALALLRSGPAPGCFSDLLLPPMLSRSWQWATLWSVEHTGSNKLLPEMTAAAKARVASGAWLVWRGNAKRALTADVVDTVESAEEVAREFSETIKSLREALTVSTAKYRSHKEVVVPSIDLTKLSSVTRLLASSVYNLARESVAPENRTVIEDLVRSLKIPSFEVAQQVQTALAELNQLTHIAKGLDPAIFSSDPHKNQFGGKARRRLASVKLVDWKPSNDDNYLALEIEVTATKTAPPPSGPVRIHLHPTFNPAVELVAWKGRKATFMCYAMGGFTLGVETRIDDIRLELDLALDERLPDWFRER